MDPRTGLDRCRKFHPPPGFDAWTVEPIANQLTDFTIPAHAFSFTESKRICSNVFLKSYICIVFKLNRCSCLFYHLTLNLRLLAAEVLHENDDQFGSGGGGGGGGQ